SYAMALSTFGLALSFDKIGGTSTIKTNGFVLYCLRFALSLDKIGCTSTIKTNKFVLYCLRFALSLHKQDSVYNNRCGTEWDETNAR
ncbi:MAG: hypothetical protein PUF39_01530, partial [Prevotellaceae bacterium]|nr:hypothetical protein [Prevotellaceae bacterium]